MLKPILFFISVCSAAVSTTGGAFAQGDEASNWNLQLEYTPGSGPRISNAYQDFVIDNIQIGDKSLIWPLEMNLESVPQTSARQAIGTSLTATATDAEGKRHQVDILAQARQMVINITDLPPKSPFVLRARIVSKKPMVRLYSTSLAPFSPPTMFTMSGEPQCSADVLYEPTRDCGFFVEPHGIGTVSKPAADGSRWFEWRGISSSTGEANTNVLTVSYYSITQQLHLPAAATAVPRGDRAPTGWKIVNSGNLTEEQVIKSAKAVGDIFSKFGLQYFVVGDGWQSASETGPPRKWTADTKRFPGGLASLGAKLKQTGLRPGIWWIPQAVDVPAESEGLLKHIDGLPFRDETLGARIWDPATPQARAAMKQTALDFINSGFEYLYCDAQPEFLNIHKMAEQEMPVKVTVEKDYRGAIGEIRAAGGEKVFLACGWGGRGSAGAPFEPNSGFGMFHSVPWGRSEGAATQSLQKTASAVGLGSRVNGNITWSDPGAARVGGSLTIDQARTWVSSIALSGQSLFFDEAIETLAPERLDIIKRVLPAAPLRNCYVPNPIDQPRVIAAWREIEGETSLLVGYFSYGPKDGAVAPWYLDEQSLKFLDDCEKFEFWSNHFLGRASYEKTPAFATASGACAVIAARKARPYPFVISTNRHVTQGLLDLRGEKYDSANLTLSGSSEVVENDLYELRIVAPDETWSAGAFEGGAKAAVAQEGRLIRVSWTPAAGGIVNWKLKFTKKTDGPASRPAESVSKLTGTPGHGPNIHLAWEAANISGGVYTIRRDGELIGSSIINSYDDGDAALEYGKTYHYEVVPIGDLGQPRASVSADIRAAQPPRIQLGEIGWTPRRAASPVIAENKSIKGTPLSLNGKIYKTGIGTGPPTILDIPLKGLTGVLSLTVGIDDCAEGKGSVLVKFSVDGKEIGRSGVLRGGGKARSMKLRLTPGKILTIQIEDAGDNWDYDYVSIVDPEIRSVKQGK